MARILQFLMQRATMVERARSTERIALLDVPSAEHLPDEATRTVQT
jgi:hypothetical protein